jgi:23S rRNA (cytosine1962-C5)-methyltransferase
MAAPDIDAFSNRLARNDRHWSRWARRQGIQCYRIYDRDVPQFPLVIGAIALLSGLFGSADNAAT